MLSLGHRYLVCSLRSCPFFKLANAQELLRSRLACLVARYAFSGLFQGNKWPSQVPRLPLSVHAPLFDPGGVLHTCLSASRTAAFHLNDGVGFPTKFLAVILGGKFLFRRSTIIQISRLNHAACTLAPPGFGLPLPVLPAGFATDLLATL